MRRVPGVWPHGHLVWVKRRRPDTAVAPRCETVLYRHDSVYSVEGGRRRARLGQFFGPVGPADAERAYAPASRRTKELIVLAADGLVEPLPPDRDAAELADQLVSERVLPGCYRTHYDGRFLHTFRGVIELVRNLLVSDIPFVPDTVGELAAHAIFGQAQAILDADGRGWQRQAGQIDAALPDHLSGNRALLTDELASLKETVLEDTDVLLLFELPATDDSLEDLARLRPNERDLLRFENWRVPFGSAPRPYITYDARAWPVAF